MTLPLDGIRVVEFSHMVMGPSCGMILADLGAEVIKVEPSESDKTRRLPGLGCGFFRTFNRNKKSVVLDIDTPEGLAAAVDLVAGADVMIENFRPGRMVEIGLGYEALATGNPRLIYVSHKGFLPGPYEKRTALDEVVQMMGGLAYMTGPPGRPLRAGTSVNDIMGGMFGVIGILAALRQRESTGRGQEIQSGLFENCVFLCAQHMQQFAMTGVKPPPVPLRKSPFSVYDTFTLAGGEQLFIAAVSDRAWFRLCEVLEADDLAGDEGLRTNTQRCALRDTLIPSLAERLKDRRAVELAAALEKAGIPYAQVRSPDQLFDDPHLKESGALATLLTDTGETTEIPLLPLMMGGQRLGVRRPLPKIGEHTEEILSTLRRRETA